MNMHQWPSRQGRKLPALPRQPRMAAAWCVLWSLLCLLCAAPPALAGRPLSSDDAATADAGSCQIEAWSGHVASERSVTLAPACGVAAGLELGADLTRFSPRGTQPEQGGLALKWVPAAWRVDSAAGELNFGLKLSGAWVKAARSGWQQAQTGALVLATLKASEAITAHANLGPVRDRALRAQGTLLNLAVVWTPFDALLLFAESQGNDKRVLFGRTVTGVGTRWWLLKDRLGLDLGVSREAGASASRRWTVGLGWYGIGS